MSWGDRAYWEKLVLRATASVLWQTRLPDQIIRVHGKDSLARNEALRKASTDFIIFCDADDSLDPYYVEGMLKATGDLRYPKVRYVTRANDGKEVIGEPQELSRKPILQGNFCIIGSMMRRELALRAGGFDDSPVLEDWRLFIRMWLNGADIQPARDAIYNVFWNKSGRNMQNEELNKRITQETIAEYTQEAFKRGLL